MRLIDAEPIEKEDGWLDGTVLVIAKDTIYNAPTVQALPIKHGYWIETVENGKLKRVTGCCNHDQTELTCWCTPKYCIDCGAKMEGIIKK